MTEDIFRLKERIAKEMENVFNTFFSSKEAKEYSPLLEGYEPIDAAAIISFLYAERSRKLPDESWMALCDIRFFYSRINKYGGVLTLNDAVEYFGVTTNDLYRLFTDGVLIEFDRMGERVIPLFQFSKNKQEVLSLVIFANKRMMAENLSGYDRAKFFVMEIIGTSGEMLVPIESIGNGEWQEKDVRLAVDRYIDATICRDAK